MVVDNPDDYVVQPEEDEKDPVAIINPDNLETEAEQLENATLASDCRGYQHLLIHAECADM
jgi:hypothetical protein